VWDQAPDRQFDGQVPFRGNLWRSFKTRQRWNVWFVVNNPGAYHVAIRYYWYPSSTATINRLFLWAGPHVGEFTDTHRAREHCYFPR
jgi:hypothetical protein